MKTQIKKISLLVLGIALLSSCNSGQENNAQIQNIKQTTAYKAYATQNSSIIKVDLSNSPLLATMSTYNVRIYDNLNKSFINKEYTLDCKSRVDCYLEVPINDIQVTNVGKFYDVFVIVFDKDGNLRGASDKISGRTSLSIAQQISSVNVYATSRALDTILMNIKNMDAGSYYQWRNGIMTSKYSIDTVKNKFDNTTQQYINLDTMMYFYVINQANNNTLDANNITNILNAFNEDSYGKFAESPKLNGDNLIKFLNELDTSVRDKGLAEAAKWAADHSDYFDTAASMAGKIPTAGGAIEKITKSIPSIINFFANASGSQAALDKYNQIQSYYTDINIPNKTIYDQLEQISGQLSSINKTLSGLYGDDKYQNLNTSYAIEQIELLTDNVNLGFTSDGTLETYLKIDAIANGSQLDASNYGLLAFLVGNDGLYTKDNLGNIKSYTDSFSSDYAKNIYNQLKLDLKIDDKGYEQNYIAAARYYNYLINKQALEFINMSNKFTELELNAAYLKFGDYKMGGSADKVASMRKQIVIPDLPAGQYAYKDAVDTIKNANIDRNSKIYETIGTFLIDTNKYIPTKARYLLETNQCDFDYADNTTLKGYCKYNMPTSVNGAKYKLNYSTMNGNDSCAKTNNSFFELEGVFNRAGNIECLDYSNSNHKDFVERNDFAKMYQHINKGNAWYWDNDNYFYPGMRTIDNQSFEIAGWFTEVLRFIALGNPNGKDFTFSRLNSNGDFDTNHQEKLIISPDDIKWTSVRNIPRSSTQISLTTLGVFDRYQNLIGVFKPNAYAATYEYSMHFYSSPKFVLDMRSLTRGCDTQGFDSGEFKCKSGDNGQPDYHINYTNIYRNNPHGPQYRDSGYTDFIFGYYSLPYNEDQNTKISQVIDSGNYKQSCSTGPKYIATNGYYFAASSCGDNVGGIKNTVFGNGKQLINNCRNIDGIITCDYL